VKVLLVDDNPRRYERLIDRLQAAGISRQNIDLVTCAMDARDRLHSVQYDLMVLDILLPLRPEDAPEERHSQELLVEILDFGELYRPNQIVGLSAYEAAADKVAPVFKEHLWTVIAYSDSNDEWISQILNCVTYLSRRNATAPKDAYDTDLVIICALQDPELKAVLGLPWGWQPARPLDDVTFVHDGTFEAGGRRFTVAAAAATRMGMVSSALLCAKLVSKLRPRYIVMTGICAGVRGKVNLGDVVLVDPSWDWQSGKRVRDKENSSFAISPHQLSVGAHIRTRFEQLRTDKTLLSEIGNGWPEHPPHQLKLVIGPVASGSAVLADGLVTAEIKQQHRDLCGIEMEAYGVYSAASLAGYPRPVAFALKAVCDFADPDKDDKLQSYASYTSAALMRAFFERYFTEIRDCV
jgi:nucleoside phosphorylase/CheY-like chemotaxis protein